MGISFIFWFLMLLVLLSGWSGYAGLFVYGYWGSGLLLFVLLGLLGWRVFGAPIRNDGSPPPKP